MQHQSWGVGRADSQGLQATTKSSYPQIKGETLQGVRQGGHLIECWVSAPNSPLHLGDNPCPHP